MATLSIKNLPDALHRTLKKEAALEGRSLNAHIIYLLKQSRAERARAARYRSSRARLERLVAAQPYTGDLSVRMLREDRLKGH